MSVSRLCRGLLYAVGMSSGLTASVAMADGGYGPYGYRGHHVHGRHFGHHHHHRGYYHRGFGVGYGYPSFGYYRGGFGITIGGGFPYRYGGFGYGAGYWGYPASIYSFYPRYTPYSYYPFYSGRSNLWTGYAARPLYGYRYERAPALDYVYPERSAPVPIDQGRYSAAKPAVGTPELRPGMILPDGSQVISVGPLAPATDATPTDAPGADASVLEPPSTADDIQPNPPLDEPTEFEELKPPANPEPDPTNL